MSESDENRPPESPLGPDEKTLTDFVYGAPGDNVSLFLDSWAALTEHDRKSAFESLSREDAEELFLDLGAADQWDLISELPANGIRSWVRLLAPDDAADLIQESSEEERFKILNLLDETTRREVTALLAYAEDDAGGLMTPRFIRLRPDISIDVAIRYLRAHQSKHPIEIGSYAYVLDSSQKLLGALSFRDLLLAPPDNLVADQMENELVMVRDDVDQEEVGRELFKSGLSAIPVVDAEGRMKGIVTVDDIVDIVQQEATEDIQKLGGTEAFDEPYLQIGLFQMVRKRSFWLVTLFLGESLTASAMGHYEHELEKALVLALFIPLIISSGGNSGSQATTLVIRALALREVRLRDWWRVFKRELLAGSMLGLILGVIGYIRVLVWPTKNAVYLAHIEKLGISVAIALFGVVLWGSVVGAMLPFGLRRLGLDPAVASAPFVATLVDVTGLIIYFSVAGYFLSGSLL